MVEKLAKFKNHLSENKKLYIGIGIGVGVAGITCLLMRAHTAALCSSAGRAALCSTEGQGISLLNSNVTHSFNTQNHRTGIR